MSALTLRWVPFYLGVFCVAYYLVGLLQVVYCKCDGINIDDLGENFVNEVVYFFMLDMSNQSYIFDFIYIYV